MKSTHEYADTPWGRWEVLLDSQDCKVKRLIVRPGQRLSYQKHQHRQEIWMVVSGVATVTLDGIVSDYQTGEIAQIPLGAAHRLSNTGTDTLTVIEVQRGTYFGEDDIIRLEDDYGRSS